MGVWDSFWTSAQNAEGYGADHANARAFQDGGYGAVEQAAGRRGDLRTAMTTRRFENEQQDKAFQWFEQNAPYARNVLRAARNIQDPQRRGQFLNNQRQRFEGMGFQPDQIDAAIAALTNPETAEQAFTEYDAAFTQHQDPNWQLQTVPTQDGQGVERRFIAPDAATGGVIRGEGEGLPAMPGEVQQLGSGGLWRENPNAPSGYEVLREPRAGGAGISGVQFRPATPEDAQIYGLPNEGHGYVIGSNGRPMAATSGGGVFPADQRARVAIMLEPALEAARFLEGADANAIRRQGTHGSDTPLGQDWLARGADAIPLVGDALAANIGGEDYQRYVSASSTFESSMLPILSGAAVTPSEAQRIIRAALPRIGDSQAVLQDKSRRRRQMLNGAALIGGRPPPYPEDGVPDWAQRAQSAVQQSGGADAGGVGLDSLSDEQLDALEQELLNGGR